MNRATFFICNEVNKFAHYFEDHIKIPQRESIINLTQLNFFQTDPQYVTPRCGFGKRVKQNKFINLHYMGVTDETLANYRAERRPIELRVCY